MTGVERQAQLWTNLMYGVSSSRLSQATLLSQYQDSCSRVLCSQISLAEELEPLLSCFCLRIDHVRHVLTEIILK